MHKKDFLNKLNQKGFSFVELFLIVVAIGIVGGAGWYVFDRSNDKPATTSTNSSQQSETTDTSDNPSVEGEFILVPTWKVKIGVGPYGDKVTVSKPDNPEADKSSIKIIVKQEFNYFEDCETHITIQRLKDVSAFDSVPKNKIGDFYYYNSGVGECGGEKESTNTEIVTHKDLIEQFNILGVKSL